MTGPARPASLVLAALTVLFGARVLGQVLVAFVGVGWLPPMEAWYSGLLPYPILLPTQVCILAVQTAIDLDVWRGRGFFARLRPRAGRRLRWLAGIFALAMLIRLVVTGSHPIPVTFHWVLAAYIFTLGQIAGRGGGPGPAGGAQRRLNTSRNRSVVRAVGFVRILRSSSPTTWKRPSSDLPTT